MSLLQQQQRQLSCGSWLQDWPSYSADTVPAKPWNSFQPLPQMLPTNCCLGEESLGHIPWHPLVPQICLIHLFTPHLQSGRNDCLPSCLLIFSFLPLSFFFDLASDLAKNGIKEGTHGSPTDRARKTTAAYLKPFWVLYNFFHFIIFFSRSILGFEQQFAFCSFDLEMCLL